MHGDVSRASSHWVIAARSYECPSAQTTGSSITSCVIGQKVAGRSHVCGPILIEQRGTRVGCYRVATRVPGYRVLEPKIVRFDPLGPTKLFTDSKSLAGKSARDVSYVTQSTMSE